MGVYLFFGGLFLAVILYGIFAIFECKAYNEHMEEKSKDENCKDNLWASIMPPDRG